MEIIMPANDYVLENFQWGDEDDLKPSRYNYIEKCSGGHLIYNVLYSSLVYITDSEYSEMMGEKPLQEELMQSMYNTGVMVKRKIDELSLFMDIVKVKKEEYEMPSFDITTTMKCNARCPYCFEKGAKKEDFSEEQKKKLIDFIVSRVDENEKVDLKWFGGEPLLGQDVIDYVIDEMNKRGIEFTSSMISNGSLLNKELIDTKFSKWKLKSIQITLDGLAENYERIKGYVDQEPGIFYRLLKNMHLLAEAKINTVIRLNVDRDNSDEILALAKLLEKEFGGKNYISWYAGFLFGTKGEFTSGEKAEFIEKMLLQAGSMKNLLIPWHLRASYRVSPCMRKNKKAVMIDIDGNIYDCERLVGRKEEAIGTLFHFDKAVNEKRSVLRINNRCKNCMFLPKCMGGCYSCMRAGADKCSTDKYEVQAFLKFLAKRHKEDNDWKKLIFE